MPLNKDEISELTHDQLMEHLRLSKVNAGEYEGLVGPLKEELARREPTVNYACLKCGHEVFEERQFRAASGGFSSIFEIQTQKYRVITCARCKYSEIYHGEVGIGQQVLDFLVGS